MNTLTKIQVLEIIKSMSDDALFCPDCFSALKETDEKELYCPNENCLNGY